MARKSVNTTAISAQTLTLFRLQFAAADPVPAEVHRAAARMAKRSANVDLLAVLAARPDAPSDLLAEYREMPEIPIRIAYLSRPEHSDATLKEELKSEKRAGVLAELVNREGVARSLVDMVGEVFCEKPTVKLAEALLGLETTPKVRLKAFEVLAGRYDSATSTVQSHLTTAAQSLAGSPLREQAAQAATSATLAAHFIGVSGLSAEVRLGLLDRAVVPLLDQAKATVRTHGRTYHGTYAVRNALGVVERLLACADLQDEVVDRVRELSTHTGLMKEEQARLKAAVTAYDPAAGGLTSQASSATGATLEELVEAAAKGDETLAVTLLTNPALPAESAALLVGRFRSRPTLESVAKAAPEHVVEEIALADAQAFGAAGGFDLFADPAAAQVRIVNRAAEQWKKQDRRYGGYHSALARLVDLGLSEEAVLTYPWGYVVASQYGYYVDQAAVKIARRVSLAQARVLGESEAAWETFNSLGENFGGTVGELLDTVAALTPAE